ncbi:MAG: DUF3662 domain-containing protein [Desulfobacula sp.]|nr:DUF3662 domain-containing protein [Desulfobacula sp.]
MGLLTKIEEVIAKPLEIFHTKKGFQPVDVCRLALKCMERGAKKGINKTYAPNLFRVYLNKSDYREYRPFIDVICSDIKGELRRVIEERDYLLAGELSVEIFEDSALLSGLPKVEGLMQGEEEPRSIITASEVEEESNTIIDEENSAPKDFLDGKTVIMLPGGFDQENKGVSIINNILGTFDTDLPGVRFHFGFDGFFLENKNLDRRATVNGKVAMEFLIKDGDKLEIKDCKFKYKENKGS